VKPLLARVARREAVERTPVWFMRQAGRSLPEYREIRERHAFFEINRSAELTAEVTLQPVRRHAVDAAVMFADIMTPVAAMGLEVELVEGVGPVVQEPVRSLAAVERLHVPDPEETVSPILEAIRIVRRELAPEQAVVGFCGGPFTVAGYLVEGKPSREFAVTKTLMYREPEVWRALLDALVDTFTAYTLAQARAGADVVQIFDSWVGSLSVADYAEFVAPWSGRVLGALRDAGVPTIHFGTGTSTLLPSMAAAGGDVIGLDWRVPLDAGWAAVGDDRGVQGNLDPAVLLGPWSRIEVATRDVLARAAGRPGHVFNLGHGVLPSTDPDVLGRVCELVHAETSAGAAARRKDPRPSGTPA
jgi:uroporphyrinogen decarboxylase